MTVNIPKGSGYGQIAGAARRLGNGDVLRFENAEYRIGNEKGDELFSLLMNGTVPPTDYSFWRDNPNAVIEISGKNDVVIDGGGARFVFSGLIQPVFLSGCDGVTVKNLTIDWERPLFSTGTIISAGSEGITVSPDAGTDLRGGEPVVSYQDFGIQDGVPCGNCVFEKTGNVALTEGGNVLLTGPETLRYVPGRGIIFRHIYSYAAVMRLYGCRNVRFENVTLHAGPGMGVIAHRCDGLGFENFRVTPSRGRPMSVNCDATHFISCAGEISFRNCLFEGMGDDAANVHGFYLRIREIKKNVVVASLDVTTQDFMTEYPLSGEEIFFVGGNDLYPVEGMRRHTVVSSAELPGQIFELTLDGDVPAEVSEGDMIVNASRTAALKFENSRVRNIRGRAVLIQSDGAEVRNCVFENCTGEGIHVNTAVGWAESGGAHGVRITGNEFINCGYGTTKYCDAAGIVAGTECGKPRPGVHGDLVISGNRFSGKGRALLIECCENVELRGNRYEGCELGAEINYSSGVTVDDPELPGVLLGNETENVVIEGV